MADGDLSAGGVAVVLTSMVAAVAITLVTALLPLGFGGFMPPPIKSAKDFTSSVCVNAHWDYTDTPYYSDYATLKAALLDLHVTCARGHYKPGASWHTARLNDLAASGIKHSLIMDDEYWDTAADI